MRWRLFPKEKYPVQVWLSSICIAPVLLTLSIINIGEPGTAASIFYLLLCFIFFGAAFSLPAFFLFHFNDVLYTLYFHGKRCIYHFGLLWNGHCGIIRNKYFAFCLYVQVETALSNYSKKRFWYRSTTFGIVIFSGAYQLLFLTRYRILQQHYCLYKGKYMTKAIKWPEIRFSARWKNLDRFRQR